MGTWGLASLVVHVQGPAPIQACQHVDVGAVEAVDPHHAGLDVEVPLV